MADVAIAAALSGSGTLTASLSAAQDYGTRDQLTVTVRAWDGHTWDFSLDRQALKFGTVAPGGDETASFTYSALKPYDLPPLASHVEIADLQGVFWIGRTGKPRLAAVNEQADITLTCYGYSHAAGDLRQRQEYIFEAGWHLEGAMRTARNDLAPEISRDEHLIADTGRVLVAPTRDFRGMTAAQIWSELAQYGDSNDDPLEYGVWNGGEGGQPLLEVKLRPTSAAYTVALSDGTTSNDEWDLSDLESRVSVEWTDTLGVSQVTTVGGPSAIRSGLTGQPITRDKWVPANEAVEDVADAGSLAQALLTKFAPLRFSGNQIMISDNCLILDAESNAIPPWRVRAGHLITITDHTTSDGLLSDTRYIQQTSYDADSGELTLTGGDLHGPIRKLKRALDEAGHRRLPTAPGSRAGGVVIKRDVKPKPPTYARSGSQGAARQAAAAVTHEHPAQSGWGAVFGDGKTIGTATTTAPLVMQAHAPYEAVITEVALSVHPAAQGNVSWAVYVNGNFLTSLSGANGYTAEVDDLPVAKGAQLRFEYYGPSGSGSPKQVTCELIVGQEA